MCLGAVVAVCDVVGDVTQTDAVSDMFNGLTHTCREEGIKPHLTDQLSLPVPNKPYGFCGR